MLSPLTKKISDLSDDSLFRFTFYCDVCGNVWQSQAYGFSRAAEKKEIDGKDKHTLALVWQAEHDAAYERANLEAMRHFNRCPLCKQWVCDDCFRIIDSGDRCAACAETGT